MARKLEPLVRGEKARTRKGFAENMEREKELGKSKKRQVGTAYGEAYLGIDKAERRDRTKGYEADMKAMTRKMEKDINKMCK